MLPELQKAFPELGSISPIPVKGGQKEVYEGLLGKDRVALKLIKPSPAGDDRADREVAAIEKLKAVGPLLNGANVPRILDSGIRQVSSADRFFIIEQFIDGENFRQTLSREPVQPLPDVLRLAKTLIGACCDFENVQMVHRDINPRNIMRDTAGAFWVIDLGLVRHLDMTSITGDGAYRGVLGTPGYAPIEVLHNDKGKVNSRADLFSVGVVLHEALTGACFYTDKAPDIFTVFRRIETTELPPLSIAGDHDGEFADFIASLAQRFPSRRPQTAAEARNWLDKILARHSIGA